MTQIQTAKTVKAAGAAQMAANMAPGTAKLAEGMMHSAMPGMANMMGTMAHSAMKPAAAHAGKSAFKRILTHPAALVGFGIALGFLLYKYRKTINTAPQTAEEQQ